ncbi:hypothetical protein [Undibacterium fentianense]|uniref:Uncharacterized protein n=1 Tax=Undibacterium fentianense TaxID=2828728 RepID=A0A941IC27_9BURK|nr:hypothetical protein [Undibacterium fentianense]MBR7799744.1 hypothetical protein [Undibacterium fentianense]
MYLPQKLGVQSAALSLLLIAFVGLLVARMINAPERVANEQIELQSWTLSQAPEVIEPKHARYPARYLQLELLSEQASQANWLATVRGWDHLLPEESKVALLSLKRFERVQLGLLKGSPKTGLTRIWSLRVGDKIILNLDQTVAADMSMSEEKMGSVWVVSILMICLACALLIIAFTRRSLQSFKST